MKNSHFRQNLENVVFYDFVLINGGFLDFQFWHSGMKQYKISKKRMQNNILPFFVQKIVHIFKNAFPKQKPQILLLD